MTYDQLLADVAQRSGLHTEVIRRVLFHLPDALLPLEVGDLLRTPLGVFRMTERKARTITLPDGVTQADVPARLTVKLRPGDRLKVVEEEEEEEVVEEEEEDD